ncbi:MAG: enoyl-CoA hydratase-related protein [Bryobacterales bacterium]|nr:enoyl-CoA hydratase-related protein [Bryobacterales bacterium]
MSYHGIKFQVREHVAHVVLNRPKAANTINVEIAKDLMMAAIRCDEDPAVRSILIRGEGPMFSGGGDLKTFASQGGELPAYLKETTTYLHGAISRFVRQAAPTVCAVHGFAAGGGFSLAIASDLVIAAESAKFTMAYTKAGLTPDGSSTYFLGRLIGLQRAMDMALTNRTLTASEAHSWGLVSRVVDEDDLVEEAKGLALKLADGPTWAYGATKDLLHRGLSESLETQMELETRAIANAVRTDDAKEGVQSFLEKREARFAGR